MSGARLRILSVVFIVDQPMTKSIADIMLELPTLGRGVTATGELRPFSAKEFFEVSSEMDANQRSPAYRALFEQLSLWIKGTLNPATAIEIGAGPGYLLFCLNRLGIHTLGVDGNPYSKEFFQREHPEFAGKYILDMSFQNDYPPADVVISIEVFEHLPDKEIHRVLSKIRGNISPKYVVFSSTPHADPHPGWDIVWGHINLKRPEQWRDLFACYSYELVRGVRPPVTDWASLYIDSNRAASS